MMIMMKIQTEWLYGCGYIKVKLVEPSFDKYSNHVSVTE
jgi:hypothetical protein